MLDLAGFYLRKAGNLYRVWGAEAVAVALEQRYPEVMTWPVGCR